MAYKAARRLKKLGVRIMTGVKVERVDEQGVVANGESDSERNRDVDRGRCAVAACETARRQDRQSRQSGGWTFHGCRGVDGVFVVGDASSVKSNGRPVPGVAQAAIQQGRYVGRLISDRIGGTRTEASVPIFRQGQYGRRWQEFRDLGERASSHERVRHMACLGLPASDVAAAIAEPAQGAAAMALVLLHRAAQFAIDPGVVAHIARAKGAIGFIVMTPDYVPALAALAGSAIGGLTSFASTWLSQARHDRATQVSQDKARRQKLYKQFIDEASKLYADALVHDQAEVSALVSVYALIGRMRVVSSPVIIESAETVVRMIVDTYFSPNKTFPELRTLIGSPAMDPLRDFSQQCREDLSAAFNRRVPA